MVLKHRHDKVVEKYFPISLGIPKEVLWLKKIYGTIFSLHIVFPIDGLNKSLNTFAIILVLKIEGR